MKKVLLLGDSIRLGYQPEVARELEGKFEVWGPEDNCRFAKYTLNELDRIFEKYGKTPDVIHWNNGLWDSAVVCPEDGMFTPPEEYERYMRIVLRELRKRCPVVLFATTTPVKPESLNQKIENIKVLNDTIVPVMKAENVPVNDLFSLVAEDLEKIICEDNIHHTEYGKKLLGKRVADFIEANA